MARQPRMDLPGITQHIVQRGNNRLPCFLDDGDRTRYLNLLGEALLANDVQLHAQERGQVHFLRRKPQMSDV